MLGGAVNDDDIADGRSEQLITPTVVPVVSVRGQSHSRQPSQNFDAVAMSVDEPPVALAMPTGMGHVIPMIGGRELDPETMRQVELILMGTKCCLGCLNFVNLVYISTGLAFLALAPDAQDEPCGALVYNYNATAVGISSWVQVLGFMALREIFHVIARLQDPTLPDLGSLFNTMHQASMVLANYTFFIYGSVVWEGLSKNDNTCRRVVMIKYPNLYGWYSLTYWLSIAFIASEVLRLCRKKQPPPPQSATEAVQEVEVTAGGSPYHASEAV